MVPVGGRTPQTLGDRSFTFERCLHCPPHHLLIGRDPPGQHLEVVRPIGQKPVEASRFSSSPEEDPPRKRIVEEDCVPDCKTYILDVTLVTGKERDMFKTPLFTYDSAKGSSLQRNCATMSSSEPEPPDRGVLPRLGAFTSQSSEAALFLPWGERMSTSPPLLSSEEGALISPDTVFGVPSEWRLPLAFPLNALSSFTGTWCGPGASILVSTGLAESPGRGAEHLIRAAFFI